MDPAHGVFYLQQDGMEMQITAGLGSGTNKKRESKIGEVVPETAPAVGWVGTAAFTLLGLLLLGLLTLRAVLSLSSPSHSLELCSGLNPLPTCPAVPGASIKSFKNNLLDSLSQDRALQRLIQS